MKQGTTILLVERDDAILIITDIPARVCANCSEPYLDEEIARNVQTLADATLSGKVSYAKTRDQRTVLVTTFGEAA